MDTINNYQKPRVLVLTDIENEPDDAMSLVRFLTYSNNWDVEGLVAVTSIHLRNRVAPERIRDIVTAYGKIRSNLELHESGFPTEEHLLSVIKNGLPVYGMEGVGENKDSSGSELLINAIDRDSSRPVWVLVWGGTNVLAQALWKVKSSRSREELDRFVSLLRVYTISDQDDASPWMRKEFPGLFFIASPGFHGAGAYHYATWSGISGDEFHGRFTGPDFSIVDNPWLDKHIRCKGLLGAQYPQSKFLMEGDTPTFLYLINNGLGDRDHPDWGSWGGRYELYTPRTRKWFPYPETRPFWSDAEDEVTGIDGKWYTTNKATIWRWREAFQNDFSARMDWTIKPYAQANHPPVVMLNHPAQFSAKRGDTVTLSAEGTFDPDGRALNYKWIYYGEAGTFAIQNGRTGNPIPITDADKPVASFVVPLDRVFSPGTMHFIVCVTNDGTPPITRYRRVIITID